MKRLEDRNHDLEEAIAKVFKSAARVSLWLDDDMKPSPSLESHQVITIVGFFLFSMNTNSLEQDHQASSIDFMKAILSLEQWIHSEQLETKVKFNVFDEGFFNQTKANPPKKKSALDRSGCNTDLLL